MLSFDLLSSTQLRQNEHLHQVCKDDNVVITADCQSYNDFCYVNSYFYDGSDFKEKIYKVYMLFDHYEYDDYDRYFDRRSINEQDNMLCSVVDKTLTIYILGQTQQKIAKIVSNLSQSDYSIEYLDYDNDILDMYIDPSQNLLITLDKYGIKRQDGKELYLVEEKTIPSYSFGYIFKMKTNFYYYYKVYKTYSGNTQYLVKFDEEFNQLKRVEVYYQYYSIYFNQITQQIYVDRSQSDQNDQIIDSELNIYDVSTVYQQSAFFKNQMLALTFSGKFCIYNISLESSVAQFTETSNCIESYYPDNIFALDVGQYLLPAQISEKYYSNDNHEIYIYDRNLSLQISSLQTPEFSTNRPGYFVEVDSDKMLKFSKIEYHQLGFLIGIIAGSIVLGLIFCILYFCWYKFKNSNQIQVQISKDQKHKENGPLQVSKQKINEMEEFPKMKAEKICSICLQTKCRVFLPCGHEFHNDCIIGWLKKKKLCPQCRSKTDLSRIKNL